MKGVIFRGCEMDGVVNFPKILQVKMVLDLKLKKIIKYGYI